MERRMRYNVASHGSADRSFGEEDQVRREKAVGPVAPVAAGRTEAQKGVRVCIGEDRVYEMRVEDWVEGGCHVEVGS